MEGIATLHTLMLLLALDVGRDDLIWKGLRLLGGIALFTDPEWLEEMT